VVALLPVDRDVGAGALVGLDEFLGLDEEAAGAAAGIVDAPAGRLDHLDQRVDHRFRGIELAATLAFVAGEFADAIFVDPPDQVEIGGGAVKADVVGEQVDQPREHGLVKAFAAKDLGQRALE